MALSDLQKLFIVSTATQMWQQDLLMNTYFQGSSVGMNLREMILGRQPVRSLTNPFDEAVTGRLRADSAALAQAGRNVREAAAMVGVAAEAVGTIKSTLQEMEYMAKRIKDGDLTYSASVAAEYDSLRDKIVAVIESTMFNGIALLDSGQWGTDQIDAGGKVRIQSFANGGFDLAFQALDTIPWSTQLTGTDLGAAGTLQTQLDRLSGFIGDMTTRQDLYVKRRDNLNSQARALESQADLLEQAVEARRQTPTLSLEEILLRLLLRNSGTLVDELG